MSAIQERTGLTKLITVGTEQEAALIVAALEEGGIHAKYSSDAPSSWGVIFPGSLAVSVHSDDLSKARRFLNELHASDSCRGDKPAQPSVSVWQTVCKALVVLGLIVLVMTYVWHILG